MRERLLKILMYTGLGLVGLAVLVVAAWVVDDRLIHSDTVARNVSIGGQQVGGLGPADLDAVLGALASETARQQFTVVAPGTTLTGTNEDVGVTLDIERVSDAAMIAGRRGGLVSEFRSWVGSFGTPRPVEDAYLLDDERLRVWLGDQPERIRSRPVEPSFSGADGTLVVAEAQYGERLTVRPTTEAARREVEAGRVPITIEVDWSQTSPEAGEQSFADAVAEAERMASQPLTVTVEDEVVEVGRTMVTTWISSAQDGADMSVVLDQGRIQDDIERLLDDVETPGVLPEFSIVDGEVRTEGGEPPMRCCDDGAADLVVASLRSGDTEVVSLPLIATMTSAEQAEAFGITEVVGEFTTNHACCEGRVENIQRIADLVRGVVIPPGERFSINEFVGRRTAEKGFVPAGTIQQGRFVDGVGGGISQFATTLFNAAFFAGLDLITYQSHSIYISRYPYGREATLSYPAPDLIVENNTPYGMLVWTSYTSTSITVQLWSTEYFDAEQTGQSEFKIGECTRVETYRRRTAPDGEVLNDMVFATYRPGEGLDCNGNTTPGGDD